MKKCKKLCKSVKNSETILPFSCCPLVFLPKKPGVRSEASTTGFGGRFCGRFFGPAGGFLEEGKRPPPPRQESASGLY